MTLAVLSSGDAANAEGNNTFIDARAWRIAPSESGPVNYYTVLDDPVGSYVHARYQPPFKTAVLAYKIPEADRQRIQKVSWSWRAVTLPAGGDECNSKKADSAAVVYVIWKRGLRYHSLKYVWSSVAPRGAICDRKRNPFVRQDTIVLESGGPLGVWKPETINLAFDYRRYFENGDAAAALPDLVGLGLMTDGDDTHSESVADYGRFTLIR